MNVWYTIPSIRPVPEAQFCIDKWRKLGYKVALLRQGDYVHCDLHLPTRQYLGWATSINKLAAMVRQRDPQAQWFVIGGDDYEPDPAYHAQEIAEQCLKYFGSTLGVMQPTGDRYGDGYIDTAAASAWLGREFTERAYLGKGPLWSGYHHMYADTELQWVAQRLNLFAQFRHLRQYHRHWSRQPNPQCPSFLEESVLNTARDHQHFMRRMLQNFPDSGLKPDGLPTNR